VLLIRLRISKQPAYFFSFSEIIEVVNGARRDSTTSKVDACGTKDGKDLAWILVNQTGEVTFFNRNGDKSGCQLNNGLKTGSWCKATDPNPVSSKDAVQSSASSPVSLPKLDSSSTATPDSSSTAAPESSLTTQSGSSVGLCSQ
jgi:hypothetical protein